MAIVQRNRVSPSPEARHLADEMSAMTGVMREILEETMPDEGDKKVHESGRTLCGRGTDNLHGPLARFPSSVELSECPVGVQGGTWHTHVTKDELRNPHNSLPDTANVLFGHIDVSIVVGTQSMDVVMAASDPNEAVSAFRQAIGVNVNSTEDVVGAILSGEIESPSKARERVRRDLSPLFERRKTRFRDLDGVLERSSIPAASPLSFEMHEARHYSIIGRKHQEDHWKHPKNASLMKRELTRQTRKIRPGKRVRDQVVDVTVAEVTRKAVRSIL